MRSVEARFAGRMIGGAKHLTNGKCGKKGEEGAREWKSDGVME
jgi:hypothetical protein